MFSDMQDLIEEAGLPWWLSGKESACQCRRRRLNPWSERFPREGNGILLQYSCLENLMDTGAWWVHGVHGPWGSQRVGHNLITEQQQIEEATGDIFI